MTKTKVEFTSSISIEKFDDYCQAIIPYLENWFDIELEVIGQMRKLLNLEADEAHLDIALTYKGRKVTVSAL